jgi:hypothetical protein
VLRVPLSPTPKPYAPKPTNSQAERDAEEETGCCGYGRFSGARNSQKSVP